jgi:TonB family protein
MAGKIIRYTGFYENGKVFMEHIFKNDTTNEQIHSYWLNGNTKRESLYDNFGKIFSEKCYSSEGVDTICIDNEKMPTFPGGDDAMMDYLAKSTKYPPLAMKNLVEGNVKIQFFIGVDGEILDVEQISKKIGWGCDEEAIRVVKSMPFWEPGELNGEKIPIKRTITISFKIN